MPKSTTVETCTVDIVSGEQKVSGDPMLKQLVKHESRPFSLQCLHCHVGSDHYRTNLCIYLYSGWNRTIRCSANIKHVVV